MSATQFEVGEYVEIADDIGTPQDGTLFRVITRGRKYHVVRQVSERTGGPIGVPIGGCAASDLIAARPATLDDYADAITLEVQRIETTHYRVSYTRREVVNMLADFAPEHAERYLQMGNAELAQALRVELDAAGELTDTVIAEQGCSDDACDEHHVAMSGW
ncbi:hypothetical protein H7I77_10050 [Mycolicibacterium novocastrense]|uniref:Uncharacterized protein n=1 Tax=Mycolicibacterium novocastrense TaxID=59813 RepID=A0AAW5SIQ0_MYCNV|nr:hypothetical protein [Mycolicibacterium novocastrense]MCV7023688.1 hypothetical protein [Mycolicibacterium novocastrense]GAT07665.1 uncharacterized protein RMCN_0798 [Mycolicibacterium novocastrense]